MVFDELVGATRPAEVVNCDDQDGSPVLFSRNK
jgi:hypothetical protein